MTFMVYVTKHFYDIVVDKDEIAALVNLGFTFHAYESGEGEFCPDKGKVTVTFSNLDELMTFVKRFNRVVLTEKTIEIYNDYRE